MLLLQPCAVNVQQEVQKAASELRHQPVLVVIGLQLGAYGHALMCSCASSTFETPILLFVGGSE